MRLSIAIVMAAVWVGWGSAADAQVQLQIKRPVADDPFGPEVPPPSFPKPKDPKTGATKPSDPKPVVATPAKKIDPEIVKLHLQDGTVVSGKFNTSHLAVDTRFGKLTIPITKLVRFTPGLESKPDLDTHIRALINSLGSNSFDERERAQHDLTKIGLPIRDELKKHVSSNNAEQQRRVKLILGELEKITEDYDENESPDPWIRQDTIVTPMFTVVGKISPSKFVFDSKYGQMNVSLGDIRFARRSAGQLTPNDVRKSLTVTGHYIAQQRFLDAQVVVAKGDRVSIKASGMISRGGSSSYRCGPDGASNLGYYSRSPKIYGGTLIARIGSGKPIKVGSNSSFTATRGGTLKLAIAMRPEYAGGNYTFPGQYNVQLKVARGGSN